MKSAKIFYREKPDTREVKRVAAYLYAGVEMVRPFQDNTGWWIGLVSWDHDGPDGDYRWQYQLDRLASGMIFAQNVQIESPADPFGGISG